jgi:glycosyltransferase involved in cell wall biosynthesis
VEHVSRDSSSRQRPHLSDLPLPRGPVRVSVVIAALNEAENLPHVLPRIPDWVDDVLLVDGHSSDGTVEMARALLPSIRVIDQEGSGKGAALRSGFAAADGDIIVALDADGSTDPAEIPAFVGALIAGADFAKGSRFLQGAGTTDMPFYRRLGNHGFVLLVRLLFGGGYTDLCYGYNAFWARCLPYMRVDCDGFEVETLINVRIAKAGLVVHEVPSNERPRIHGQSKLQLDCDGFEIETLMNVRALRVGLKVVEVASYESPRIHGSGRLRTIPDGWRVLRTIWREWGAALPIPRRSAEEVAGTTVGSGAGPSALA